MKLILSLILVSNIAYANCNKPVSYLTKGSTAPCNGYLFTPEKELEVRNKIQDLDTHKVLVKQQDELINVLNNRIEVKEKQVDNLRSENTFLEKKNTWSSVMYFLLGIGTTLILQNQLRK